MKKSVIILALTCLLIGASTLMAQDYEDETRDVLELSFSLGLGNPMGDLGSWNDSLGASTGILFGLDAGYFLNSDMVLGFNFTYSTYGIDSPLEMPDLSHRFYNPSLYLKYYFWGEGDFAPYVKGSLGIDNLKFTTGAVKQDDESAPPHYRQLSYDPALSVGLTVGVFKYTSDYSGLFLDATYHHAFTKNIERQYNGQTYVFGIDASMVEIRGGISVYFGSDD